MSSDSQGSRFGTGARRVAGLWPRDGVARLVQVLPVVARPRAGGVAPGRALQVADAVYRDGVELGIGGRRKISYHWLIPTNVVSPRTAGTARTRRAGRERGFGARERVE